MTTLRLLLIALAGLALAGCASRPDIALAPNDPPLVLEEFFPGRTVGEGAFTNGWTGDVQRFSVVIDGTWDGATLTLVEDFAYPDGTTDRKTWRLTRTAPGTYSGAREDVVGVAQAFTDGRSVRLEYDLMLGGWELGFQDQLVLRADGTLLNVATVSKWGIAVGTVELTLRRAPS